MTTLQTDFYRADVLIFTGDPRSLHISAIISRTHSLLGRPTLPNRSVEVMVPGIKQATRSGCSGGDGNLFPNNCKRFLRSISVADLWRASDPRNICRFDYESFYQTAVVETVQFLLLCTCQGQARHCIQQLGLHQAVIYSYFLFPR